jgi:hypothetical protein
MQIGCSDILIKSVLSVLGTTPGRTMRCSSYTILDMDTERVAQSKGLFQEWADSLSFDGRNAAWTENSIDLAIICSNTIANEEIQSIKECVHPGGLLIMQIDPEQVSFWVNCEPPVKL